VSAHEFSSVVIVAPPGRLRDSLRVLLRGNTGIRVSGEADDGASALRLIAANPPTLAVLDANLNGDGAWWTLRQIKSGWPQVRCILLAHDAEQQQRARAASADGVFLAARTAEALALVIRGTLARGLGQFEN
jgi:DNA-binding NarL/FixJ family response regulator